MKALMTNSTQPDIFAAKMRDDMYLKHLRQVQKINNREALDLKVHLNEYNLLHGSLEKTKRKAKQFQLIELSHQLNKKNYLITQKIKNIRSMFGSKNTIKSATRAESLYFQKDSKDNKLVPQTSRYHNQNDPNQSTAKIQNQNQDQINKDPKKSEDQKRNRMSLHYYLRKRQQEMIEHENQKLKNGILSQKSVYSPKSKKNSFSLKLPSVKSARHNFNQNQQSSPQNKQPIQKQLNHIPSTQQKKP